MDAPEVVDCLQSALNIGGGKTPSALDVFRLVTSACTDEIGKQVGQLTPNKSEWEQFWARLFGVAIGGPVAAGDTLVTALSGISMQFVGTLRVGVGVVRPQTDWIKPFVGEWRWLRSLMRINTDGTGKLNWSFPDQALNSVDGQADVQFKPGANGVVGVYRSVTYRYRMGGGTPKGRMPIAAGDTFELSSVDVSLLRQGAGKMVSV